MSDLNLDITELKPTVIEGPFLSHFIGQTALRLPQTLNLSYLSVKFSPEASKARAGRITFHENGSALGGDNPPLELPLLFRQLTEIKSLLGEATAAGEYELDDFDRPARLIIHLTRNSVLDDIRADLELPPAPKKLEIDLAIEQDWGFLEFSYEEIFSGIDQELESRKEEAKSLLLDWVKKFLPNYHWKGANEVSPPGALTTRYGYVTQPDDQPEMAGDYYASFEIPQVDDEKSTLDFLTFTVKTAEGQKTDLRAANRKVGGHHGYESRKLSRLDESSGQNPLPGKELVLYLEWQDLAEKSLPQSKSLYDAALYASVTKDEQSDLSYYLGLWDSMLDSVQGRDEDAALEPQLKPLETETGAGE